jgi:hypothetical protein
MGSPEYSSYKIFFQCPGWSGGGIRLLLHKQFHYFEATYEIAAKIAFSAKLTIREEESRTTIIFDHFRQTRLNK